VTGHSKSVKFLWKVRHLLTALAIGLHPRYTGVY
jgi:hypothetical protein